MDQKEEPQKLLFIALWGIAQTIIKYCRLWSSNRIVWFKGKKPQGRWGKLSGCLAGGATPLWSGRHRAGMLGALQTATSQPCAVLSPSSLNCAQHNGNLQSLADSAAPRQSHILKIKQKGPYSLVKKRNRGMMIFRCIQWVADTMFYLTTFIPGTISVPCVKKGRRHQHKAAFVNTDFIRCKTDLSSIKAL